MKKSKFIVGLTAAFLSGVALMSCSSIIKPRSGVILTINGVEYTAEDLFKDQKTPAAAEAKFNAVYKVAVRAYFVNGDGQKDMEEIKRETKIKISEQKSVAQSNADKNHTSYDVEWKKILDSNGVDNEKELYDKFEYDLQKEKFENKFYEDHYDDLREGEHFSEELKDVPFTNYIQGKQPYHVKHILVKIAGMKAGDEVNAEITSEEAKKLAAVINHLSNGDRFGDVAKRFSDDTESAKNKGSLGIMSRDTSFVNDFKLGVYLYESFFGTSTKENSTHLYKNKSAIKALGLDNSTDGGAGHYANLLGHNEDASNDDSVINDPTTGYGIGQIPCGVADALDEYSDYDFSEKGDPRVKTRFENVGLDKDDIAAKFYPRNVIFNKYFNKHNIMVITPKKLHDYTKNQTTPATAETIDDWVSTDGKTRTRKDTFSGTQDDTLILRDGFKREKKNTDDVRVDKFNDDDSTITDKTVLRDENGRVILVFRSGTGGSSASNDDYQGIHFVVIERSPFIAEETDNYGEGKTGKTNIEEYYTHFYPEQPGGSHPVYEGTDEWKHTFVNYFSNSKTIELKDRADTVKSELKKCDPKLETYLYQHLCAVGNIEFTQKAIDLDIPKSINSWIDINRKSKVFDDKKTWDETWKEYYYSLESQQEQRNEYQAETTDPVTSRLIPEICAVAFADFEGKFVTEDPSKATLVKLFDKGGVFHE